MEKENNKLKTILMADSGHLGADFNSPVRLKDCDVPKVVVIDDNPSPKKVIEINGIKYERRERESSSKGAKSFGMLAAMTMAMGAYMPSMGGSNRKRPVVDIVSEFELIQQKKSNLGRNDRDWVCNQFLYDWKQITE